MKNSALRLLFVLTFIIGGSLFAGESAKKLPMVKAPSTFTNQITVTTSEVLCSVDGPGIYAVFTADHKGALKNLRIVMHDATVYEWDCQFINGKLDLSDGWENGVHADNTISVDRAKWLAFFQQKVALRPFEFQPTQTTLKVSKASLEYAGRDPKSPLSMVCRVEGAQALITLDHNDCLFMPPTNGKFYLGMKDGRMFPLLKTTNGWSVPVSDWATEITAGELFLTKRD